MTDTPNIRNERDGSWKGGKTLSEASNKDELYAATLRSRIQTMLNDIKRPIEMACSELKMNIDEYNKLFNSNEPEDLKKLLYKIIDTYPISLNELYIEKDTTDDGVVIQKYDKYYESRRTIQRANASGVMEDYYEYRDCATCSNSTIKPEVLRLCKRISTDDTYDPEVRAVINRGHLFSQITVAIGEVNSYYEIEPGNIQLTKMNTGDTLVGIPYVPHTYIGRSDKDTHCGIVACTFGIDVVNSVNDCYFAGSDVLENWGGDSRNINDVLKLRIKRQLELNGYGKSYLKKQIIDRGINESDANETIEKGIYNKDTIEKIAEVLRIHPKELTYDKSQELDINKDGVVYKYWNEDEWMPYGEGDTNYMMKPMASCKYWSDVKGIHLKVMNNIPTPINIPFHQFIYNLGETPFTLHWGDNLERTEILKKCESAYIKPGLKHAYTIDDKNKSDNSWIFVLRIPGGLTKPVLDLYSTFDPSQRRRVTDENARWF